MDKKEEFLTIFRELEEEIVKISGLDEGYVSFNRALNEIHSKRLDPIIASDDAYEFLKSALDLRNILSHRNNVAEPTDIFLERFKKLSKNIIYPKKLIDIATKGKNLVIAYPEDKVITIVKMMSSNMISHVPVYDEEGLFLGVFSRVSFFEFFSKNSKIQICENTTIADIIDSININNNTNELYLFASINNYVIDFYNHMNKTKKEDRRLSAIFLTKNGKKSEPLLGIVTQTDILKMILEETN